jgi:hypothetical protein
MDQAFQGSRWHSLLGNLQAAKDDDWLWVPPDGRRSIRDIVGHLAGVKLRYVNTGFGDSTLTWDDLFQLSSDRLTTISDGIEWLKEVQAPLRQSVAGLNDADLMQLRKAYWRDSQETRWQISVMIEHDLYHAGEINHIRCLHQGDDE